RHHARLGRPGSPPSSALRRHPGPGPRPARESPGAGRQPRGQGLAGRRVARAPGAGGRDRREPSRRAIVTEALAKAIDVRRLVGVLAAHPILPPIEAVSSDTEALRSVLADLARGEDSSEIETLRAVAADLVVPVEELIHRAQFV